jgi:hypothetical protein
MRHVRQAPSYACADSARRVCRPSAPQDVAVVRSARSEAPIPDGRRDPD